MTDDPPRPKVIIANISPGSIRTEMVKGLINAVATGAAVGVALTEAGPYLDRERNIITAGVQAVRRSGQLDWEWMLFVDSDIEFNTTHIDSLLSPTAHPSFSPVATPILGGLYYSGFPDLVPGSQGDQESGVIDPVVFEWVERTFDDMPPDASPVMAFRRLSRLHLASLPGFDVPWNLPPLTQHTGPVCAVGAVGTGFMAIHHTLLDTLEATFPLPLPYFDEPVINGVHLGEDMGFCRRVAELGYPVLVNRACVVLHHKTMKLA